MENRACHPGNGERQKRTDSSVRKAQKQTHDKADLVRLNIAEEPSVRSGRCLKSLPEGESFLCSFALAHEGSVAKCLASSEFIALITASVEIWCIGTRERTGENSAKGDAASPCKISA